MLVDLDGVSVITVQTILSAEPHKPLTILDDRFDDILRQSLRGGNVIEPKRGGLGGEILAAEIGIAQEERGEEKEEQIGRSWQGSRIPDESYAS